MLKEINIENLEEKIILTSVNQTWFKFLAIITILCSVIIYTALIWLLVCRTNRLRPTDEEIKKTHLEGLQKKDKRKSKLKRNIRYLFFGNSRSSSPTTSSVINCPNFKRVSVNEINETNAKSNKSKYKRRDSKFKDLHANLK